MNRRLLLLVPPALLFLFTIWALLSATTVQAGTAIAVTTTEDELNTDGDCSLREAIQAANTDTAVDACPAGSGSDTITLPAGTYTLTLAGAGEDGNATGDLDITGPLTLNGAAMATTIIDANSLDRALHVPTAGITLTVLNLTVRNGRAFIGSGGGLLAAGAVVVSNTSFLSNIAVDSYSRGGGADVGGPATVNGATFSGNHASGQNSRGGGAYFGGPVTVVSTSFAGNTAETGGGTYFGGAATVTVTGTTFVSNTATNAGGAYFSGSATVTSTTFAGNWVSGDGGGASFPFGYTATVSGTTFVGNTANSSGGAYFGGPVTVMGTTFNVNAATFGYGGGALFYYVATVMDTTFTGNTALSGGGGAVFYEVPTVMRTTFTSNTATFGYGGGASFGPTATVTGTTFLGNMAYFGGGGASFSGGATVAATTFVGNMASSGGGVYFSGYGTVTGEFVNTLFASNRAQSNDGAGLYAANVGSDDLVTLRHVTIASPTVGSGSAVFVLAGTLNVTNSIIGSYSVGLERAGGTVGEDYNLFSDVATPFSGMVASGGNSITGTTAFADLTTYRLTSASTARDMGADVGVTVDFEGDPRICPDLGWDEIAPPEPVCGLQAANSGPTILGDATTFTATVIGEILPVSYAWDFGDATALGSGATTTHTYAAAGSYTAMVTATNSLGSISASTPVTISQAEFRLFAPLILHNASPSAFVWPSDSAPLSREVPSPSQAAWASDPFSIALHGLGRR